MVILIPTCMAVTTVDNLCSPSSKMHKSLTKKSAFILTSNVIVKIRNNIKLLQPYGDVFWKPTNTFLFF